MSDRMIELISGRKYYGKFGVGWIVLVNGHPHHELTKKGALEFVALLNKAEASDGAE